MNAEKTNPGALDLSGKIVVILFLLAGIIHLVIVPQQWGHAPAHGIFMAVSGLLEIGWAVLFYRRPTKAVAEAGIMIAITLIALWIFTRFFSAPFGTGPEEIDLAGVVSKLLEGVSSVLLARYLIHLRPNLRWYSESILSLFLFGVLLAVGVYIISFSSQPFLPGLASPESHNLQQHLH
jgi:hypothetical protein